MSDWVKQGNFAAAHFTVMQGRVLFHMERLFRSTGGGIKAHARYVELCRAHNLPRLVTDFHRGNCFTALQLIEVACKDAGLSQFRQCKTGWQDFLHFNQFRRAA